MFIILSSPKGGSGTSVTAAALAVLGSQITPTLLVDLAGDQVALLGLPRTNFGLTDWLDQQSQQEFDDVIIDCGDQLFVVPLGSSTIPITSSPSWPHVVRALEHKQNQGFNIVVDAGSGRIPADLAGLAAQVLLVIRPCYLALHRTVDAHQTYTGVIVVLERDRVLTTKDVETILDLPCVAQVPLTADIARRVDSGLLQSRMPHILQSALAPIFATSRRP